MTYITNKDSSKAALMISYDGLLKKLSEQQLGRTELARAVGLSSRTVAKIGKGEPLSRRTLDRIANYLGCNPSELCRTVSSNQVLQALRDEKEARVSGGIYHELQVRMTYNSNHMEGSMLSEEQTRMIFETRTINSGDGMPVDDIIETMNHFRAIDYVIDVAEEVLSEQIIKHIHLLLKHDTKDAMLEWFAVGDYKQRPNMVGGRRTTAPKEVPGEMRKLLIDYNARESVCIEDVISFHAAFERIHPFQDGNGRVGRLIALKECLRHNLIPFIIEDSKKSFYYRGLAEWDREQGYLIDTCLDGQDTFAQLLDAFDLT